MTPKKIILAVTGLVVLYAIYYCSQVFPIATGYGAKIMCSGIFVSGRTEKDIKSEDLNFSPLNLATFTIDLKDSSVTCTLAGLASQKAVYRHGLGATLVNDLSEKKLRAQRFAPGFKEPRITSPGISDAMQWPIGDKISVAYPVCVDSLAVAAAVNKAFTQHRKAAGGDTSITNITRALIVLYDGQIVAEKYAAGFTASTKLTGWSMTKSITSALIGILVKQNKINIDAPAPVQEWKDAKDPRHKITVKNLLQQASGLHFEEVYDKSSDANKMLFIRGDAAAYAASLGLNKAPGSDFRYSSGNTNILSRMIREIVGEKDYHQFPYKQLFHKIGMYNTVLEPDASGTFVGSSFCYATARDWARFGLFYLNNGKQKDEQILPEGWVKQSVSPSAAAERGEYGFQWWLNAGAKNNAGNRIYPDLPTDMFYADGYEGQNVFVIPSKKLVVVRLGLTRTSHWGESELLKSVIAAIHEEASPGKR